MLRRLDDSCSVDNERRLTVRLASLDEPGDAVVAQEATPRSS